MAQVIIPLDVPTLDDAMGLVDSLGEAADFYKVGLELFTAEGSAAVQALKQRNIGMISIKLDQEKVIPIFYKKQDYEPFSVPMGFPVLEDINWKA